MLDLSSLSDVAPADAAVLGGEAQVRELLAPWEAVTKELQRRARVQPGQLLLRLAVPGAAWLGARYLGLVETAPYIAAFAGGAQACLRAFDGRAHYRGRQFVAGLLVIGAVPFYAPSRSVEPKHETDAEIVAAMRAATVGDVVRFRSHTDYRRYESVGYQLLRRGDCVVWVTLDAAGKPVATQGADGQLRAPQMSNCGGESLPSEEIFPPNVRDTEKTLKRAQDAAGPKP